MKNIGSGRVRTLRDRSRKGSKGRKKKKEKPNRQDVQSVRVVQEEVWQGRIVDVKMFVWSLDPLENVKCGKEFLQSDQL